MYKNFYEKFKQFIFVLIMGIINIFGHGFIIWFCWNNAIANWFSVPSISVWQACALFILFRVIMGQDFVDFDDFSKTETCNDENEGHENSDEENKTNTN